MITSRFRDVPCYKEFPNSLLFKEYKNSTIKIFEYFEHYLHAKAMLVDDEHFMIGSFNLDQYSWFGNNEIMYYNK